MRLTFLISKVGVSSAREASLFENVAFSMHETKVFEVVKSRIRQVLGPRLGHPGHASDGSKSGRQEIANEIDILIAGLGNDLTESTSFKHVESAEDLMVISTILINLSFTWAMTWRNMRENLSSPQLETEQQQYIDQVTVQVRLLFRGIENWQSAE